MMIKAWFEHFELIAAGWLIMTIALCYLFFQLGRHINTQDHKQWVWREMCRKCPRWKGVKEAFVNISDYEHIELPPEYAQILTDDFWDLV